MCCIVLYLVLLQVISTWIRCSQAQVEHITTRPVHRHNVSYQASPPQLQITSHPREIVYKDGDFLQLNCSATGSQLITYTWTRDSGTDPRTSDGRIYYVNGTLYFNGIKEQDAGIYQCCATNVYGKACTDFIHLHMAYLWQFRPSGVNFFYPNLGEALSLPCVPPESYPKPNVWWGLEHSATNDITLLNSTDRITVDEEGILHFAHVKAEDNIAGATYTCIVINTELAAAQIGERSLIRPQGATATLNPPRILYHSPTHQRALAGEMWSVQCIFSGNPTPDVWWEFLNNPDPINKTLPSWVEVGDFGRELVIVSVMPEHTGSYRCMGLNLNQQVPTMREIRLVVQEPLSFISTPQRVIVREGEVARVSCEARGEPPLQYQWSVNSRPLQEHPIYSDPRLVLEENHTLVITDFLYEDMMVVQCNVSNRHGYLYENIPFILADSPAPTLSREPTHTTSEPPVPPISGAAGHSCSWIHDVLLIMLLACYTVELF